MLRLDKHLRNESEEESLGHVRSESSTEATPFSWVFTPASRPSILGIKVHGYFGLQLLFGVVMSDGEERVVNALARSWSKHGGRKGTTFLYTFLEVLQLDRPAIEHTMHW